MLAARLGADSADHLIMIDEAGTRRPGRLRTRWPSCCPARCSPWVWTGYAPAREMIDQGCALALATDFNPGSSPILSMPLIMAIACTQMRLTPAESLVGATLNAAWALGRQDEVGSLAPGKWADFLILDWPMTTVWCPTGPATIRWHAVFLGGREDSNISLTTPQFGR